VCGEAPNLTDGLRSLWTLAPSLGTCNKKFQLKVAKDCQLTKLLELRIECTKTFQGLVDHCKELYIF
jgi:hypothetical protein